MRIGLDLDGTLISCMEKHTFLMKTLLAAHGKKINIDEYWSYKREGLNNIQALKECGIETKLSELLNIQWIEQVELVQWMELDTVLSGVYCFLDEQLSNQNFLHLISARNNEKNSTLQLKKLDLMKYFETVSFVNKDLGERKSDKFIKYEIDLYIGDTEYDFFQAEKAGIPCYLVGTGMRSKWFLKEKTKQKELVVSEIKNVRL